MHSGILIRGRILGSRTANRDNNSPQHILGVGIQKADGFGGTTQDVEQVKIPDQLVQSGVVNQINSLIGKLCEVPINVRSWSMNGKNGTSYTLSFDSGIQELKS
ncbi:TPA: DNA-binding protein [Enterobacter asburiae]|nr:DNA-binding protein [Enterobacter asburiae]